MYWPWALALACRNLLRPIAFSSYHKTYHFFFVSIFTLVSCSISYWFAFQTRNSPKYIFYWSKNGLSISRAHIHTQKKNTFNLFFFFWRKWDFFCVVYYSDMGSTIVLFASTTQLRQLFAQQSRKSTTRLLGNYEYVIIADVLSLRLCLNFDNILSITKLVTFGVVNFFVRYFKRICKMLFFYLLMWCCYFIY